MPSCQSKGAADEHDAGEAGDEELEEEADAEHHGHGEDDLAAPYGRQPVEDLDAGRHGDDHGGEDEEGVAGRTHADGEHVVRPDAEADEADGDRRSDHGGIAEDGLAREDGDDLVGEGEGGQDEDVDLGMAEDPEEVHPQDGGAAGLGVEEVRAEVAVEHEHDLRGGQRADGDEDQAAHDEVEPDQQRHAAQLHARAAHAEDGGDDVERGADGADAAEEDGEGPIVGAVAGREDLCGERSVGEPADVGRGARGVEAAAADVAEVEQQAGEGGDPEAEGVEAREGHVARADHQRDKIVAEAEEDGHAHEEDHGGAVHGEELVEDLRRDEVIVGHGELNAHQDRFEAGDDQKDERVDDVHQADLFVVDGGQPLVDDVESAVAPVRRLVVSSIASIYRSCGHALLLSGNGLVKLCEIGGDDVEVVIVQMHSRHQRAGLHGVWIVDPLAQIFGCVRDGPEAMVSRLARCVRSGPKRPVATVPAMAWQLMQAFCMKTVWPSAAAAFPGKSCAAGFFCCSIQAGEILRGLRVDAEQHLCVLGAAVLRALAEIEAGLPGDRSTWC